MGVFDWITSPGWLRKTGWKWPKDGGVPSARSLLSMEARLKAGGRTAAAVAQHVSVLAVASVENCSTLGQSGVLHQLIENAASGDAQIESAALKALQSLSILRSNMEQVEEGTVSTLVDTLKKAIQQENSEHQRHVLGALFHILNHNEQACISFWRMDGSVKSVIALLDAPTTPTGVLREVCGLLWTLCATIGSIACIHLGEQEVVVNLSAIMGDPSRESCWEFAAPCLALLCKACPVNRKRARECRTTHYLMNVFCDSNVRFSIRQPVCNALALILAMEEFLPNLRECAPRLLEMLSACCNGGSGLNPKQMERQATMAADLTHILLKSKNAQREFAARDGVQILSNLLLHKLEAPLPTYLPGVIRCLIAFSSSEQSRDSLRRGCLSRLTRLLSHCLFEVHSGAGKTGQTGKHLDCILVGWLAGGCLALACTNNEANQKVLVRSAGLAGVFSLLLSRMGQQLLRHRLMSNTEMLELKQNMVEMARSLAQNTQFHSAIRDAKGVEALKLVHSQMTRIEVKVCAKRCLQLMGEMPDTDVPFLLYSDRELCRFLHQYGVSTNAIKQSKISPSQLLQMDRTEMAETLHLSQAEIDKLETLQHAHQTFTDIVGGADDPSIDQVVPFSTLRDLLSNAGARDRDIMCLKEQIIFQGAKTSVDEVTFMDFLNVYSQFANLMEGQGHNQKRRRKAYDRT